jgi:predicted PurR-regulated permease PerM
MIGIDYRAARWTWTAALVLLGLWLVYLLRSTLFLFILAMLFAYLLAPLVNLLDRFLPGSRTRTLALALSFVLVVGLVVLGAVMIGSRVVQQATELAQTFPSTL